MCEEFAKIEFVVDFNGLPDNEEDLEKGLSKEDEAELDAISGGVGGLCTEGDDSKLMEIILTKKDSLGITLTKEELAEAIFHSTLYLKMLTTVQQLQGQYKPSSSPRK